MDWMGRNNLSSTSPTETPSQDALRLRVIADALPAYIAYIDRDLRYAMINRTYEEWFARPADRIVGWPVHEVLGASYANVSEHLEGALRGEPQLFESLMLTAGGERWLMVRHLPDFGPDGMVRGVIVHGIDITERKRSEEVMIRSEKLAAVGRLASSIAHEINNPLESVVNLLYLIELCALESPEQTVRYARTAQEEIARVSQIATQTLRFFRQTTAPLLVNMAELIESVLTLYHGRLINSTIHVERRLHSDAVVLCFDGEIRQVFNNLVSNALDAMRNGGTLRVRARRAFDQVSGHTGVRVTVADTGEGMSPETLSHIFEAFYTTKGISGTGLGLWVSSGIIQKHDGRLSIRTSQTAHRRGSVFALFLPALP
jgi:PAS domain S-box-containing protein